MRLWSIHPKYLDPQGLVAHWRETLLAQAVLHGETKGYKNHPQLHRFKGVPKPLDAIAEYLSEIHREASTRGYKFDASKVRPFEAVPKLEVTRGQVLYEWSHLQRKLQVRNSHLLENILTLDFPELHPSFTLTEGEIESWEVLG